jgi:hypothetical protein
MTAAKVGAAPPSELDGGKGSSVEKNRQAERNALRRKK